MIHTLYMGTETQTNTHLLVRISDELIKSNKLKLAVLNRYSF